MFVFPVASLVLGVIGYYVFKNIYVMPILIAIISVISVFTVFNSSFWFWAALYTLLSLLSGLFVKLLASNKKSKSL
ncbi:DUF2651 family protein [Virgibacillus sp. CBA3643]|uniref:DUF2651 family protein n=1 Tax=Virgibacillus sp. CBA3643 TaxID=2942278 RepID=UPI0035A26375